MSRQTPGGVHKGVVDNHRVKKGTKAQRHRGTKEEKEPPGRSPGAFKRAPAQSRDKAGG